MDFQEAVEFCVRYKWTFGVKMTELFICRPWDNAPADLVSEVSELTIQELFRLVQGQIQDSWPLPVKEFVTQLNRLSQRSTEMFTDEVILPSYMKVGMSSKKRHEVCRASSFIHTQVLEHQCDRVIDIGCGLGYLGNSLSYVCSIDVVGVELDEHNCQTAKDRAAASSFLTEIHQLGVDHSSECTKKLRDIVIANSRDIPKKVTSNACMVGLHCCADLTPSTLYQFTQLDCCKALVCFGCCYHRMTQDQDLTNSSVFNYFPLSEKLKCVFLMESTAKDTFNQYAMRQACQETSARWLKKTADMLEDHYKHVTYRAVFEYCCQCNGLKFMKNHKRLVGVKDFTDFSSYTEAIISRSASLNEEVTPADFHQLMLAAYKECAPLFRHVRWYDAIQTAVQNVLESIIMQDRLEYLTEQGITAKLVSVFDEDISPRNVAIVAHKCQA